jgi:RNA polymerase sigma factor for flagellar operon FliA
MTAATAQRDFADAAASRDIEDLVTPNVSLVGHLVRELVARLPAHVCRDDLMSAGLLALVTSARAFDESRGVPFARFAAIRIRGALTDELRGMDWASRAVRSRSREVDATRATLAARLYRAPTRAEVAAGLGISVADVDAVDADVHRAGVLSLQSLTAEQGDRLLPSGDDGPEGLLLYREQIGILRDAVAALPERQRTVVEQYFLAQRKMADIALELGVTESRISQLRSEALAMLRLGLRAASGEVAARPAGHRTARTKD